MVTITKLLLCEQEKFYDALKYFLKLYLLLFKKEIFCTLIRQKKNEFLNIIILNKLKVK